ncbi:MAG: MBL fold metallo-hydrolase [Treponema sp.]|nr:MBL fold metallo-hydrolase [Treponema sp.]
MKIEKLVPPLKLTTSGDLSLFFIGTGSAFSKKYFQNNVIFIKGDNHVLVDCGTLCPLALHSYQSGISSIRNIFISHSHADHIGGLEEAALLGKYATKVKPNMVITDEYKKILWEQSLKGGCAYGEKEDGQYLGFDDYFVQIKPEELKGMPRPTYHAKIGSIDLKMFRTMHIPGNASSWKDAFYSLGLIVDDRIFFSADSKFDRELIDWVDSSFNIEYFFHDCQFYTGGVHAGYDELKTLPAEIKKRMYLCHYGDNANIKKPTDDGFAGFAKCGYFYNFDK